MDQKQFRLKDDWEVVLGNKDVAEQMNAVARLINNMTVVRGGNLLITENAIEFRFLGGGSAKHPWQVSVIDDAGTLTASVCPGSINSIVPTNIFSTFTVPATGTRYLVLEVSATDESPQTATLSLETTQPVPSLTTAETPPTVFKDVIAIIDDGKPFQIRSKNLIATSVEVYQETVSTPGVNERQYIPWYRWEVTSVS